MQRERVRLRSENVWLLATDWLGNGIDGTLKEYLDMLALDPILAFKSTNSYIGRKSRYKHEPPVDSYHFWHTESAVSTIAGPEDAIPPSRTCSLDPKRRDSEGLRRLFRSEWHIVGILNAERCQLIIHMHGFHADWYPVTPTPHVPASNRGQYEDFYPD